MPQLKIVCLAHPATWSDVVKSMGSSQKKLSALNSSSRSWLNLGSERGERSGVYKVDEMAGYDRVLLRFVAEADVNEEHPSVEKLLAEDDCLPEGIEIPAPVPRAMKALLFFDLVEGVCYAYAPGMAPEADSIFGILERLQQDTGLPLKTARIFEWKEELVTSVTEVARKEGFNPYKVQADLETVKVSAEGDLQSNEDWKKIEGAIDLGRWRTIAYVRPSDGGMFVFGLTRRRSKQISLPQIEEGLNKDELLERIVQIRSLLESALGCDVRQYCFPEPVTPLTQFLEKK